MSTHKHTKYSSNNSQLKGVDDIKPRKATNHLLM